ncbi:hypothetical protein V8E36_001947 [Tilletia maclaganii]
MVVISDRLRARVARTVVYTPHQDGTSFSSTQGGTTYFDSSHGTLAVGLDGVVRNEPNDDCDQPELTLAPVLDPAASTPSPPASNELAAATSGDDSSNRLTQQHSHATQAAPGLALTPLTNAIERTLPPSMPHETPAAAPPGETKNHFGQHTAQQLGPIHTSFAASDISLQQAYGQAARNAVLGRPGIKMQSWFLERVVVWNPASPPSTVRGITGTKSAFYLDGKHKQRVTELWRCRACDTLRKTDPNVTNNLQRHTRKECKGKENPM